jgi:hypothetical protein
MAKKIIIDFTANPIAGTLINPSAGVEYGIFINGSSIVYNSGYQTAVVQFVPYGTVGYNTSYIVEAQPTLSQTIQAVLSLLTTVYSHPNIVYSIVNNTIEVLVNINEYAVVEFGVSNVNIIQTSFTPTDSGLVNLRYFFQYKNIVGDEYLCRIYKKQYTGEATEIHGKAIIEKGSVKDHLDPIRGTGLSLELEASVDVSLDDLYTENEQDLSVRLYKNGKVVFVGYVNPEGLFQSYTRDKWVITLGCVDGLGALSNLSFVDPAGIPFDGKMKASDIVYHCLLRSGISLPINISINTFYDGLTITDTTDILTKIYVNANRFKKIDDSTIMSCEEVLASILDLFCACITQENGEWYIFKPNEIYSLQNVVFKRYNVDNVYVANVTVKMSKNLGSNIDNYYPHHCGGNQNIQIKGSVSAFRINYKYGLVSGIFPNPNLTKTGALTYDGWTVNRPSDMINDPLSKSGFIIKTSPSFPIVQLVTADGIAVIQNDALSLKLTYSTIDPDDGNPGGCELRTIFKVGAYYLKGRIKPTAPTLEVALEWTTNSTDDLTVDLFKSGDYDIAIPPMPATGILIFSIERAISYLGNDRVTTISRLDLKPTSGAKVEIGEFHTASRGLKVSSNVKENKTIFNGDNAGVIYLGAILKEDQTTPTTVWNRKGRFESFPLLRIAAEEELRISQKPLKIFKGSVYGQLPYLSVININNITGKFMFIEYSHDTMTNISQLKLLELYSEEVTDLIYKFTTDYGNVVKPTIVS